MTKNERRKLEPILAEVIVALSLHSYGDQNHADLAQERAAELARDLREAYGWKDGEAEEIFSDNEEKKGAEFVKLLRAASAPGTTS